MHMAVGVGCTRCEASPIGETSSFIDDNFWCVICHGNDRCQLEAHDGARWNINYEVMEPFQVR